MTHHIPNIDICSLSDFKQENIMVSRFSDYLKIHKDLVFPHRHSFYHLVLFTEGAGSHTIDFRHFEVQPSQIYFMVPGQVHTWNFKEGMDGYLVNFSVEFFNSFLLKPDYIGQFSFLRGATETSVFNISQTILPKIISLFEELLRVLETDFQMQNDLVRVVLLQIFIEIERNNSWAHNLKRGERHSILLKNFRDLIENNFTTKTLPAEYASVLAITPNHLNALCKEHLGMQAGEVIRKRILLEAKRLLVSTDLTVAQIAYQLNFNDNSYFTRFFKKLESVTPDEFRKKAE